MAEPARKYNEDIQPEIRPDLPGVHNEGESAPGGSSLASVPSTMSSLEQSAGRENSEKARHSQLAKPEDSVDEAEQDAGWNFNSQKAKKSGTKLLSPRMFFNKKAGPTGAIVGIIVLLGLISGLLSPALLLVHFKETMLDKFNDQLSAMDLRAKAILKKKLTKNTIKGVCSPITIRCKYQSVSNRQIKKFEKAEITVNGDKKTIFGRTKPESFEFKGKTIPADQLVNEAVKDPSLRSAINRGYNPKFYAFSDGIAKKVRTKLGLRKTQNITATDEEKIKEEIKKNASGEAEIGSSGEKVKKKDPDCKSKCEYVGPGGTTIDEDTANRINNAVDEIEAKKGLADAAGKTAVKSGLKGALTSTAFGLGAADSACTAWNILRLSAFAAKLYGQRQMIRYYYQFANLADEIKAGDAKPEPVSAFGKIITSVNSQGKSATDSDGYKYAAYGDTFKPKEFDSDADSKKQLTEKAIEANVLANETSRYINGQIIPSNLFADFVGFISKGGSTATVDDTCSFIKSWQGQTIVFGTAIAGAVVGFFTGGATVSVGAVAQLAVTASISVAMAIITPKLMDLAKGELITGDENGNEAGNALTSGAGGFNSQASQGRGLAVLNKDDAVAYSNLTKQVAAQYDEDERAELSPFDVSSKNTFLGSVVSQLIPYTSRLDTPTQWIPSTLAFTSSLFSKTNTLVASADGSRVEEFESCPDPEYTERNLAADPFCNLRYGLSKKALDTDPEVVLDYMINNKYISEDMETTDVGSSTYKDALTAEKSGEYKNFIENCIEREKSIGDNIGGGDTGDECIQGSKEDSERNTMFRLFYIDSSINEGMDNGPSDTEPTESSSNNTATSSVSSLTVASYNLLHEAYGQKPNKRIELEGSTILGETNGAPAFDIVGMQEVGPGQLKSLQDRLTSYDSFPQTVPDRQGIAIMWNKGKFSKVGEGRIDSYSNGGDFRKDWSPWVKLQSKDGQNIYILNVHVPNKDHGGGDPSKTPGKNKQQFNADAYHAWAKSKSNGKDIVIVTGDFNGSGKNGADNGTGYCTMTKDATLQHAHDLEDGKNKNKP